MKSKLALIALAAAMAFSLAAVAQDGAAAAPTSPAAPAASGPMPTKVAIIDIQGAIGSCNEGQRDLENLKKKYQPKEDELRKSNEEIQGLQNQLKTQGDKMNEDARNALTKSIEQKQRALQQGAEAAQADYQGEQNDIGQRIGKKMYTLLDKYATDNGFAIVFDVSNPQTNTVLWANQKAIDLTPTIISLYNAQSGISAPAGPRPASSGTAPRTPGSAANSAAPKRPAATATTPGAPPPKP